VMVHAMGKASAARVTLRTVEALEQLAERNPPMAYDIRNYASLGILSQVLNIADPAAPNEPDLALVCDALAAALADIQADPNPERGLAGRLQGEHRAASRRVRELLNAQWEAAD
jgi:malonate decarboxylase gamma subunit